MEGNNQPVATTRPRGGDRRHQFPGRQRRINLRLNDDEYLAIAEAAGRADVTPAGFCADAALTTAQGTGRPGAPAADTTVTRAELAQLQRDLFTARTALVRVGTLLNQAVAALQTTSCPSPQLAQHAGQAAEAIAHVDAVIDRVDRSLR